MPATAIKPAPHDPKREILDKLGDVSHLEIAQNEVLLAIYQRPNKTPGGIMLTDRTRKEDVYQGKVGLVVKIGSACRFKREDAYSGEIFDLAINLHDWVVVRASDTWSLDINGNADGIQIEDFVPCRLARDKHIRMRVADPLTVW